MTDDRFEQELRVYLGTREPAEASAALRARVAAVSTETPVVPARWRTRSLEVWRGAFGLVAAVVVGVLVVALLSRLGQTTVREGETVGAPSMVPAPSGPPFIEAPTGFFTPDALRSADERLGRVFADTAVEGTLIVRVMPNRDELTAPDGWQERHDRDGDDRRDVVAVAGITPDDTITCCITLAGATIDQARQNLYWQPIHQPSALDDELSAATPAERDAALGAFVRGIEDLATGITELGIEPHPSDALMRWMPVVLVAALVGLAIAAVPRRRRLATSPDASLEADGDATDAPVLADGTPVSAPRRWSMSGSTPLFPALGAFGALAALTILDLLRTPDPAVPFETTRASIGIAQRVPPVAPAITVAIALIALIAYALQGGWRRRLGILAAIVLIIGSGWLGINMTRPVGRDTDITWIASPNARVTTRQADGIREFVTYDVAPGDTFTMGGIIRNPGVLPLTILGLEDVQQTTTNPYIAAIVGLGWVPQPTDDGRVSVVSAAPGSASAGWPVTLAPGEELSFLALGRAGACAEAGSRSSVGPLFYFPVRYRVLGFEQTAQVPLPASAFVAAKDVCTAEVEGGTITYGPPPSP